MATFSQNIEQLQSAISTADEQHKKEVSVLCCSTIFLKFCFEKTLYLLIVFSSMQKTELTEELSKMKSETSEGDKQRKNIKSQVKQHRTFCQ